MGMFDYVKLQEPVLSEALRLCPSLDINGLQTKCGDCILTTITIGETVSHIHFSYSWDPNVESTLSAAGLAGKGGLVHQNEREVNWADDFQIFFYDGRHEFKASYRDGKFHKLRLIS